MRSSFLLLILLLMGFTSKSQSPEALEIVESTLEELEGDFDYEQIFEQLVFLFENPVHVNKATKEDLSELFFLTPIQIENLVRYREKYGNLISIYELQAIPEFDLATIYQLLPYIKLPDRLDDVNLPLKTILTKGEHNLFVRYEQVLEEQKGYIADDNGETPYLGSQFKLYTRYRYQFPKKVSFGITAEKDAGEAFFDDPAKNGFDFYSAHFFWQNEGVLKALAIGDYDVRFGQGLTYWSGFGFGKGSAVMNIMKTAPALKPYSSTVEAGFNRGVGVSLEFGDFDITAFGSYLPIDANITAVDSFEDRVIEVSSLINSGFHRTQSQLDDKNAINTTTGGVTIGYDKSGFHIGASSVYRKYSAELNRNLNLYNQYEFTGDELFNASIDYSYLYRNLHFFGETALSDNGGWATLNGMMMSLNRRVDAAIYHRHFDKNYQAVQANVFSESSKPANEQGLYLGLLIKPNRRWQIATYADHFKFPWLKFGIDAPSAGREYLLQVEHTPSRSSRYYFRFKNETKMKNYQVEEIPIDGIVEATKRSYRLHFSKTFNKEWTMNWRVERSEYHLNKDSLATGIMLYHDLVYKPWDFPVSFNTRFALFDTDNFNAAIYAYEHDVLYAFYVPSFSGRGMRYYFNVRYKMNRNLDFWLKFDQTYYTDRTEVSSGNELIEGNRRTRVKAQCRLRFK